MTQKDDRLRFRASGLNASLHVICDRYRRGEIAVCPSCGSDLVVALSWDDANKHSGHPGVFCSNDSKHFQIVVNVAS